MRKKLFPLLLGFVIFLVLPQGWAEELEDKSQLKNVELILDVSESMSEKLGGEVKLDIAKRVLTGIVNGWEADPPKNLNVGLRMFGHSVDPKKDGKEASCLNTVMEVPIQGLNTTLIREKVAAAQALGFTPIALSLIKAMDDFSGMEGSTNAIILVSDGQETCGGDPYEAAIKLNRAGIGVTVHVIGFAVDEETEKKLAEIARLTSGMYVGAKDADELEGALKKTFKAVDEGTLSVNIVGLAGDERKITGKITDAAGNIVASIKRGETVPLPAGTYTVEIKTEYETLKKENVVIRPGKETPVVLWSTIALLEINAYQDGKAVTGRVSAFVFAAGTRNEAAAAGKGKEKVFALHEGKYDVLVQNLKYEKKPDQWLRNLELTAGKKTVRNVDFMPGALIVIALVNSENVSAGKQHRFYFTFYKEGASKAVEAYLDKYKIDTTVVNGKRMTLPEGRYEVFVDYGSKSEDINIPSQWISDIEIQEGTVTEKSVDFSIGFIKAKVLVNGEEKEDQRVYLGYYKPGAADADEDEIGEFVINESLHRLPFIAALAPGTYDVRVRNYNAPGEQWMKGLEVVSGETVRGTVNFAVEGKSAE